MEYKVFFSVLTLVSGLPAATGTPLLEGAVMVEIPPAAGPTSSPPRRLIRPKRCSCSSLRDKECIYFCHLDIIWINTPEQVVPYGLGGSPRARRSTKNKLVESVETRARCECGSSEDDACQLFCEQDQEATRLNGGSKEHAPVGRNWMDRLRSRRRQDSVKVRSLGLRAGVAVPRCRDRPC